jgi:adenine-specific DNA-methyltransferase
METQYGKLKKILIQIFQLDQADLDFGIYRIMNQKRDEIEHFLDKELLPQVKEEFSKYKSSDVEDKQRELAILEKTVKESGLNPDDAPKVKEIREQLAGFGDDESLINEVFSHLTTFFSRYYDNGDFLSLRRYKKNTYAIPYEGEEVKLHWANADQYYIKSTEYLKIYVFKIDNDKRVHFKLVDATEEKDNVKQKQGKERKFKLYEAEPIKVEGNDLYIQFTYLSENTKQSDLNKKTVEYVISVFKDLTGKGYQEILSPKPTLKNPKRTLFEKHLNDYTARFNFDFFIHKDLGNFMQRELDFYIKNEVLFIDDLDELDDRKIIQSIGKVKVLKHIAQKIISFLAQLEEFQKKMWLKKKFVVDCGYCVTLDRVPAELYDEIAKNNAQRVEWVRLFAINEIEGNSVAPAYSEPLTVGFLKTNPFLVLDTKFFNNEFKDKLLASIDNIDEECDGLIINSDNFQALNLIQETYQERIKCVYIDPPYNSDASEIVYKNGYKHSSWLTLLYDRFQLCKNLLNKSGILEVAIDDIEFHRLESIIRQTYGDDNYIANIAIMHNPKGRDKKYIATAHEYTILASKDKRTAVTYRLKLEEEALQEKYPKKHENKLCRELPLRRSGSEASREDRPYMFFPFIYDQQEDKLTVISEPEYKQIYDGSSFNDDYVDSLKIKYETEGVSFILPIRANGSFGRWRWGYDSCIEGCKSNILFVKLGNNPTVYQIDFAEETYLPKTFWYGERYDASTKGTNLLKEILKHNHFDYPKSIYAVKDLITIGCGQSGLILDYFAGSGTTAHATIELNREDEGKRKYILIEMGQYFDTVLKQRIQKVVYSKDWKEGMPVLRKGISHMFKYMKLESYDDTLDNLIVNLDERKQKALNMSRSLKEDYVLGYMLEIETRESDCLLNIDKFEDPFNYTLKIRDEDELRATKIDLIETFNYLIGLCIEQTEIIRGFKILRGRLRSGEKTLVIWRNTVEKSNEDLDKFFTKQRYNTQDFEFDRIFVNGDNNLDNLKVDEDKWKVCLIEEEFKKRMFEVREI